ncbi:SDR family oxidoreductase [Microlunatus parietis]|uniref:NAD(P)-dependent dehydrogenase (Short-subunit alcohol dehydrogenase family) n=1 Tax=Microlunatus parietis TaxID=682979 RepID=A0A7Y9IC18_9ACTN|nr:SDR family oxidoreductase [Microlunatus parietis]NYE73836.1 NAD(P)-dependent dehydrogenase (short-subunit alcohol dehydrogenase family) [Microlunatus parietis]
MTGPVLITGGSRGIGAATARRLAADGRDVVITYASRAADADQVITDCRAAGVTAHARQVELTRPGAVDELFGWLDAEVGPIGALVNNAGVVSPGAPVADYDSERVRRVMEINVVGAFAMATAAARRMAHDHGGAGGVIVNVSSRAAVRGGAFEYVDYAASKAAIDALTTGLGLELARQGVRVAGVRPGVIDTEIHAPGRLERVAPEIPLGRAGTAEEIAAAIAWLLSDDASYVTGTTIDVGGGR